MKDKKLIAIFSVLLVIVIAVILCFVIKSNSKDIYKFDFFNGYIPGATYTGEINLKTGETDITVTRGCSLPSEECSKDNKEHYTGTLEKEYLDKTKEILEKTNYKDNEHLIIGIADLLRGDELCINEDDVKKTCREIGVLFFNEYLSHSED